MISPAFHKRRKRSGGFPTRMSNVRTDLVRVLAEGTIHRKRFTLLKGLDGKIRNVLRYFCRRDVTQLLASGTICLKSGNDWKVFRGVVRKLRTQNMWRSYRVRQLASIGTCKDGPSIYVS